MFNLSSKKALSRFSVIALLLTIFVDAVGWGLIFPSLTPLLVRNTTGIFAASVSTATRNVWFEWIVALYSLSMLVGAPMLGSLSDRIGRRPVLLICLIGSTISYACTALGILFSSIGLLSVGRLIGGLTAGSMPIAQSALMDLSTGANQKAQRLSWVTLASNLGFACGPVLGAVILGKETSLMALTKPFGLGGLLAILGVLLIFFGFRETLKQTQPVASPTQTKGKWWQLSLQEFRVILSDQVNRRHWLNLMLSLTAYSGFIAMLPILFSHLGFSSQSLGYAMTWFALINGASLLFLFPCFLKKLSLKTLTLVGLVGSLIGNLFFPFTTHVYLLLTWMTLIAISAPFSYIGLVTSITNNQAEKNNQGKIMGLAGSLMALSWVLSPLLAGVSTQFNYYLIYLIYALLLLVGCGLLKTVRK